MGVWVFDCSSSHEALAPDALNVNQMNVNPGGKQRVMRDTIIPLSNLPPHPRQPDTRGQPQSLVFLPNHPDPALCGKAKGMKAMLQEHGSVWACLCEEKGGEKKVVGKCAVCKLLAAKKDAMQRVAEAEAAGQDDMLTDADIEVADAPIVESTSDWCCMYRVISLQEDFQTEKPMIQHFLEGRGHKVIFLPKFHCEFAPIEMLWGFGKYREFHIESLVHFEQIYTGFRQLNDGKFKNAKELVLKCLDMADVVTIRRFFRKVWRYMDAYR